MSTDHIVPQSAEFYIKGALIKSLLGVMSQNEMLEEIINHPDSAHTWREQARGLHNYNVQWFKEAVEEFKKLDPELTPNWWSINTEKVQYLERT